MEDSDHYNESSDSFGDDDNLILRDTPGSPWDNGAKSKRNFQRRISHLNPYVPKDDIKEIESAESSESYPSLNLQQPTISSYVEKNINLDSDNGDSTLQDFSDSQINADSEGFHDLPQVFNRPRVSIIKSSKLSSLSMPKEEEQEPERLEIEEVQEKEKNIQNKYGKLSGSKTLAFRKLSTKESKHFDSADYFSQVISPISEKPKHITIIQSPLKINTSDIEIVEKSKELDPKEIEDKPKDEKKNMYGSLRPNKQINKLLMGKLQKGAKFDSGDYFLEKDKKNPNPKTNATERMEVRSKLNQQDNSME